MKVTQAWEKRLEREGHVRDPVQQALVTRLDTLCAEIERADRAARRPLARLMRRSPPVVTGMYLWGGVGRGKTFLMDLFYDALDIEAKRRVHFHRIMQDVHARLAGMDEVDDPLDLVAAGLAAEARVVCFDEFFVSDIGDAMILGRLLRGLFSRGVTLVATSNVAPDDLYRDGLQRSRFLPAIELLKAHTEVIHVDGDTDYRLRLLERAGTYLVGDEEEVRPKLARLFEESASTAIESHRQLMINGRPVEAYRCAKGIAWFDFDAVCEGPRSQQDYIELARWYPSVLVSGVPQFGGGRENAARRFIALVDEFYDRRVKLIVGAAAPPESLYRGRKLAFEFERTTSRLIEMQTREYLARPHLS